MHGSSLLTSVLQYVYFKSVVRSLYIIYVELLRLNKLTFYLIGCSG